MSKPKIVGYAIHPPGYAAYLFSDDSLLMIQAPPPESPYPANIDACLYRNCVPAAMCRCWWYHSYRRRDQNLFWRGEKGFSQRSLGRYVKAAASKIESDYARLAKKRRLTNKFLFGWRITVQGTLPLIIRLAGTKQELSRELPELHQHYSASSIRRIVDRIKAQ